MPRGTLAILLGLLTQESQPDLADWLSTREVVVEGTTVAVSAGRSIPSGKCGEGLVATKTRDVTIRVESVLIGVSPDTVCTIRWRNPAGKHPAVGQRVLAYAFHDCTDSLRLYGSFFTIEEGGRLGHPNAQFAPVDRQTVVTRLRELHDVSVSRPFEHFDGACLVRVVAFQRTDDDHFPLMSVEGAGWLVGRPREYPREVIFHNPPDGCETVEIGDTLLVPLSEMPSESVLFTSCPNLFRLKDGLLQGFGIALPEFESRAIRQTEKGFELLPILGREGNR